MVFDLNFLPIESQDKLHGGQLIVDTVRRQGLLGEQDMGALTTRMEAVMAQGKPMTLLGELAVNCYIVD